MPAMTHTGRFIIALDQGTTSSRAILYDCAGKELKVAARPLAVRFPQNGWVEQDPKDIWETQSATLKEVSSGIPGGDVVAIGITNQRETLIAWDRDEGTPLAPAIVWQCRRSAEICKRLRQDGLEEKIKTTTGLVLDPYFSATKALWMIENIDGLRSKVRAGKAIFGTVDSWILYNLTRNSGKPSFCSEPSNASRTMLFSLLLNDWDADLLAIFSLTRDNLCRIQPSSSAFGVTDILGAETPITGILGDQQASLFGHGCCRASQAKCTFGTGAFLLANTGDKLLRSSTGLITTVAWDLGAQSQRNYALEGSIFIAGALIQWLRDKLGIISSSAESEAIAGQVPDSGGVIVVPAFVGFGAPHWDDKARGSIQGIQRDTSAAHIVRAALEGVAHQVADLLEAEEFRALKTLKIDGGMSANVLFCRILADLCGRTVEVAPKPEMTAFGAGRMAALGAGVFGSLEDSLKKFVTDNGGQGDITYSPDGESEGVKAMRLKWKEGVKRSRHWA